MVFGPGIEATFLGEATADAYAIAEDAAFAGKVTRTHAVAGVETALALGQGRPLRRDPCDRTRRAAPLGRPQRRAPAERGLGACRIRRGQPLRPRPLSGSDAVEQGARANIGIGWTRHDPDGWSLGLTAGRVFREQDFGQFGPASGLAGRSSDWLVSASLDWQGSLVATGPRRLRRYLRPHQGRGAPHPQQRKAGHRHLRPLGQGRHRREPPRTHPRIHLRRPLARDRR